MGFGLGVRVGLGFTVSMGLGLAWVLGLAWGLGWYVARIRVSVWVAGSFFSIVLFIKFFLI